MNENTKKSENCPREAAAQLRTSIANVATLPKNIQKGADTADVQKKSVEYGEVNGMAGEKKEVRQLTPGEAAGQLRKSITNVATLPKAAIKLTESVKKWNAEKGK